MAQGEEADAEDARPHVGPQSLRDHVLKARNLLCSTVPRGLSSTLSQGRGRSSEGGGSLVVGVPLVRRVHLVRGGWCLEIVVPHLLTGPLVTYSYYVLCRLIPQV